MPLRSTVTQVRPTARHSAGLACEGISKRWRGAPEPVLDHVELLVEPGMVVCVTGANGAGKTTLLRIAAGALAPDTGRVLLGSIDPATQRTEFHRRIGYLSSSSGLYARLTVRDHLRFWSRLALLPRRRRAASIERTLDSFGLRSLADRRVDRISMGQRQRVRLAGAFLHEPDVVLLDEPATSLDEAGLELLAMEMRRARADMRAVMWCVPTGVRELVENDLTLRIDGGRLVQP